MKFPGLDRRNVRGSALVMVLVLSTVTLLLVVSTLQWTTTNATLSQRNNEYYRSIAIAEAATEKIITRIDSDYKKGGDAVVIGNVTTYASLVPSNTENSIFANYEFKNGQGEAGKTYIQYIDPTMFTNLTGAYRGLYGYSSRFRIISNARDTTSRFNITGAVEQGIELATIPLFQFAIFYNLDLEMNPGANMTVTGPVHGNRNIYLQPNTGKTLSFLDDVTSAQNIIADKKPGDPLNRLPAGTIDWGPGEHDDGVAALNLPIGTNNSPAGVHQVVERPTSTNDTPELAKERFYNKADMVITLTGSGTNTTLTNVTVRLGSASGTVISSNIWNFFLDPGEKFYNKRENKTVNCLDINITNLWIWDNTNTTATKASQGLTNGTVTIIYVDDQRNFSGAIGSSWEPGVRVKNGYLLPPKGLTIATPVPIYTWGHYNIKDSTSSGGSSYPLSGSAHNTLHTKPAALIGDAITVLSSAWTDANSTNSLGNRDAVNTTVNAAFLAGIVETASAPGYSGGVENFPRFLEDWSGKTFVYNGSMVVMYPSQWATGLWINTGAAPSGPDIYNPPVRDWAFDMNFRDVAKLPPGTPCARKLIRSSWAMIKPNSTASTAP